MNRHSPHRTSSRLLLAALLAGLAALPFAAPAAAQNRDHLTPEEVELIRDNQELDKRTAVFVRAAERRLLAATDPASAAKQAEKEREKWGEVKGSRADLLYDLSRILDEAVVNVDDVAARTPESPLIRKSLYALSQAAGKFLPLLLPLRDSTQEEKERDYLERAIETAEEIVEAAKTHAVTAEDLKTKSTGGKKGNN
ncbi:MAG TPA: hypothetical protein VGX48_26065 [Pyrinomonadaceae bacterium]|jgi:hypothetical protein|nr:hypothetical protein [Pyrinomonadaceae bacterium]